MEQAARACPGFYFFCSAIETSSSLPLSFPEAGPGSGTGQLRASRCGGATGGAEPLLSRPASSSWVIFPLLSRAVRTSLDTQIPAASPKPQSGFSCTRDRWTPLRAPRTSWAGVPSFQGDQAGRGYPWLGPCWNWKLRKEVREESLSGTQGRLPAYSVTPPEHHIFLNRRGGGSP